jgi:hypothetical protein
MTSHLLSGAATIEADDRPAACSGPGTGMMAR